MWIAAARSVRLRQHDGGLRLELTTVGREVAGEVQRRRDDPLAVEMTHAAVAGSAADGGRGADRYTVPRGTAHRTTWPVTAAIRS